MTHLSLAALGWQARRNTSLKGDMRPARIASVARNRLEAISETGVLHLTVDPTTSTGDFAVGDWVLFDPGAARVTQLLDRATLLQRKAPGRSSDAQLIAANVDTLGIVSACNADFNPARIERYLALAANAGCLPLLILTHADQVPDAETYVRRAMALSPLLVAVSVDARDDVSVERLAPWCGPGETLALVGSSGVGKTTLTNALTGSAGKTQAIRQDDAKGRHTTTARMLKPTLAGGWLVDTPGMRELGLTQASDGIGAVFTDLESIARQCRFSDCHHDQDPGCAIAAGLADGSIEPDRVLRWQKLKREDARNSESALDRRKRYKSREQLYSQGRTRGRLKRGNT